MKQILFIWPRLRVLENKTLMKKKNVFYKNVFCKQKSSIFTITYNKNQSDEEETQSIHLIQEMFFLSKSAARMIKSHNRSLLRDKQLHII